MRFDEVVLQEKVLDFEIQGISYLAHTERRRIDILKTFNHQPPITDEKNYSTFMWVKAYQGYYVLRQEFVELSPLPWTIIREIIPEDPGFYFFEQFDDQIGDYLERLLQSEACDTDH